MRRIEILAPAGSYDGMRAAMNAGCDAVYIGGSSFGARAYADNPDEVQLLRAIDEAHIRDKKLYLAVNTLLKEKELTGRLYSFLEKFYLQGLDAVIVQDVGVMHFIHDNFPGLSIHASTQMTLTMAQGAEVLKDNGVSRLVTARELSFREIKAIRESTELEIETFVHGALCYCYSGQCLMSSIIGGRSGNRGRCAQPCRMPYRFYLEGKRQGQETDKYLLSPKDINTIANIPELVESGVDSFKIEGRMKRPEYAAAVVSMYRKYLDSYMELGNEKFQKLLDSMEYRKDMLLLQDVYNRGGFSAGYGNIPDKKSMMSMSRPNHSGVDVGEVTRVNGGRAFILLTQEIHAQDILEIRTSQESGYEFTVKDPHSVGDILETRIAPVKEAADRGKRQTVLVKAGMKVYRTRNNELLMSLTEDYLHKDRQLGIRGYLTAKNGERLSLTVEYKHFKATVSKEPVQQAVKQPMTREKLTAPICKTGDTLFYFEELITDMEDHIFVPVAWLNEIRREALQRLKENITGYYRREAVKPVGGSLIDKSVLTDIGTYAPGIVVSVQTSEQLQAALTFPEITDIMIEYDRFAPGILAQMADKVKSPGVSFHLALPHICRLAVYQSLERELPGLIEKDSITGFLARNFEEVYLLQSLLKDKGAKKQIRLNHNMYVFNQEAKSFWQEKGIRSFTAPLELNSQELKILGVKDCDLTVYGYLPLMVSTLCLIHNTSDCQKGGKDQSGFLTDRLNKKFLVQTVCKGCYHIIYNGQPLSLHNQLDEIIAMQPENIRMDFTFESPEQLKQTVKWFVDSVSYGKKTVLDIVDYTTGHYRRGIE